MDKTPEHILNDKITALLESDENNTFLSVGAHQRVVYIWCYNQGIKEPNESTLSDVEEAYQGEFDNMTRFAEHLVDECDMLGEMPENLRNYFDYELFGRDLVLGGDYWIHDCHVFQNI